MTIRLSAASRKPLTNRLGWIRIFLFAFVLFGTAGISQAVTDLTVFGPVRYERMPGAPTLYTAKFGRCNPSDQAVIRIQNGDSKETRISSAKVSLNGEKIFAEKEFKKKTLWLEKLVTVQEVNSLEVKLKSGRHDDEEKLQGFLKEKMRLEQELARRQTNHRSRDEDSHDNHDNHDNHTPDRSLEELRAQLAELVKKIAAIENRAASFVIVEVVGQGCDATPPVISNLQPLNGELLNTARPLIGVDYSDESGGAGIVPASVQLTLDGSDVTGGADLTPNRIEYSVSSDLPEGSHTVQVRVSDRAGNWTEQSSIFTTDTRAPLISIGAPLNGFLTNLSQMDISAAVDEPIQTAAVNGGPAVINGLAVSLAQFPLVEGNNNLTLVVTDLAGNPAQATVTVKRDSIPPAPPSLAPLVSPTNQVNASLSGSAEVGSLVKFFRQNPDGTSVQVRTVQADTGGLFSVAGVTLVEGDNPFFATATDAAGNTGGDSSAVSTRLDTRPPQLTIATPVHLAFTNQLTTILSGSADEPLAAASLNGHSANVNGAVFSLDPVVLVEGTNRLMLNATDLAGNMSRAEVLVERDTLLPVVTISAPLNGLLTNINLTEVVAQADEPILTATINGNHQRQPCAGRSPESPLGRFSAERRA